MPVSANETPTTARLLTPEPSSLFPPNSIHTRVMSRRRLPDEDLLPAVVAPARLVHYDAMCRAIALAYEVDEVKDIRDKHLAIEVYARQAQNTEAERQAREIRIRAERKAGELLAERVMARGGRPAENRSPDVTGLPEPLRDINVSKRQSADWQRLAAVPEPLFEQGLAEPNPSTTGIIMRHEVAQRAPDLLPPVDPAAMWVWGRLQDFERHVLAADPATLLATMSDPMRATTLRLLPLIIDWLQRVGGHEGK